MSRKQVTEWATSAETVSSVLASDPQRAPGDIAKELYKKSKTQSVLAKVGVRKHPDVDGTQEECDFAARCGAFDKRPSDLFLKLLANVLVTLDRDPLAGLVSPPLLASTGTIPLSIISVIPDQMRHYANAIVRTEHEALIATNFLEPSNTAKLIGNSLRELSKRHEGTGKKVVVKFIYDRGSPKQLAENHILVPGEEWPNVDLPTPEEIPNIDMQVLNFHRPPLGTFHTKLAVFDRKIALLSSCNMQDRVNVEMTVHLEGAIVDSFYDVFLLSWDRKMEPPPPLLARPAAGAAHHGRFGKENEHIQHVDVEGTAAQTRDVLRDQRDEIDQGGTGEHAAAKHIAQVARDRTAEGDTQPAADVDNEAETSNQLKEMNLGETGRDGLAKHLNVAGKQTEATTEDPVDSFNPHVLHAPHDAFPIAMVNRRPHGRPGHGDWTNPQDAAWLAGFRFAQRKVFIQTPTFNATNAVEACLETCKRGVDVTLWVDLGFNDQGEMIPRQGGTNEDVIKALDQSKPLNASEKARNCHVKFASFDDTVAVVGNGNMDTQSWYHSQEINVMVDSPAVIAEWHKALDGNQNTSRHGRVDDHGIWRYPDGTPLESLRDKPGTAVEGVTKGIGGALARARGTGGF